MPVVIDDHLPIDEQLAAVIGADEEPPQVVHSGMGASYIKQVHILVLMGVKTAGIRLLRASIRLYEFMSFAMLCGGGQRIPV